MPDPSDSRFSRDAVAPGSRCVFPTANTEPRHDCNSCICSLQIVYLRAAIKNVFIILLCVAFQLSGPLDKFHYMLSACTIVISSDCRRLWRVPDSCGTEKGVHTNGDLFFAAGLEEGSWPRP